MNKLQDGFSHGYRNLTHQRRVKRSGRELWRSIWRARSFEGFGRALRIAALAILGLELVYVLGANVILKTGILERWINDEPADLRVSFEGAWTILPGRFQVRNFALRLQDENVQVWPRIPEARGSVTLRQLFLRRFHISGLKAEGLSFRLRVKISDLKSDALRARAFAPIEGFADPPIVMPEPPEPSTRGTKWTIEIADIEAEIKELWLLEYRYVGEGRATGGFRLKPRERLRVDPSAVVLEPATVTLGEKTLVAERVGGRVECRVDDFDLAQIRGLHVFQQISAKGSLTAQLADMSFTRVYLAPHSKVAIERGAGPLALDVELARGTFAPGSRLSYRSDAIELQTPPYRFSGDAVLEATVAGEGEVSSGRVVLSGKRVQVHGKGTYGQIQPALVSAPRVELESTASRVDGDWSLKRASFDSASASLYDVRLLNALLDPGDPLKFRSGSARGRARAEITSEGRLLGKVEIAASGTELDVLDDLVVRASGTLKTELRHDLGRTNGRLVGLEAVFEPVSIENTSGSSGKGRLQMDDAVVLYDDFAPRGIKAKLYARFPKAEPVLAAFGVRIPKLAAALTDWSDLKVTAELRHDGVATDVRLLEARTRGVKGAGRLHREGKHMRGAFLLDTPLVQLGVSVDDDGPSVSPFVSDAWLAKKLSELDLRTSH